MEDIEFESEDALQKFTSNPKIAENEEFLRDIGVFTFVENLTRRIHSYKTLLSKGLDIFNRTTIDEIMDATVRQISDHFLPSLIAFLWKPIQNRADITIRGYKNYKQVDFELHISNITPFEAFFQNHPKPILFDALSKKLGDETALEQLKMVRPEIIVPILGPFGLYGIILIGRKTLDTHYTREEQAFIEQLMSFVSQAIKNNLHYEHSLHDVKTGLYNHGFFMTRLKEEITRTKRSGSTSSIIVMDVDRFKNFNDTYGHLAGDQVLEKLAQVIRQNVRTEDIPSRFGGEEFNVLLPHTEISTAWAVSERLRNNVSQMEVPWEVPLPRVTISLGVFAFNQNSNLSTSGILSRADEALYISKSRGRNCSTIWEPGLISTLILKN